MTSFMTLVATQEVCPEFTDSWMSIDMLSVPLLCEFVEYLRHIQLATILFAVQQFNAHLKLKCRSTYSM